MDSFTFDALDSAALDETLFFLNNSQPTMLPHPSFGAFGDFAEPTMGWSVAVNPAWAPLDDPDLSGGVRVAPTYNLIPGSDFFIPGWSVKGGPYQEDQVMTARKSSTPSILSDRNHQSAPAQASGFPASQMTLGDSLNTTKEETFQDAEQGAPDLDESYRLTERTPLPCIACGWPSCRSTAFYATIRDLQNHQTDVHVAEILKAWPGSCSWPGFKSKISFKTGKRLEYHVYNIHITPLCCTVTGCGHSRPFERQADLERHVATVHENQRRYKCHQLRYIGSSDFSRKDKLKLHERTCHGPFSCPLNHCTYGFQSEGISEKHKTSWEHYQSCECALGSCGRTWTSHFRWLNLNEHLQYDHLISPEARKQAMRVLRYGKKTLTLADFPDGIPGFQDCKSCIKILKEAASDLGQSQEL